MKRPEFEQELAGIVAAGLPKTARQYRRRAAITVVFSVLAWIVGLGSAFTIVGIIFSPLFANSSNLGGWLLIAIGTYALITGFLDLAKNLNYSAMLDYRRFKVIRDAAIIEQQKAESK